MASDVLRVVDQVERGVGVCIKLNEIGTVTEWLEGMRLVEGKMKEELGDVTSSSGPIFMRMSGVETEGYDGNAGDMVVDLVVGARVPYLKIGRVDSEEGREVVNGLMRMRMR